MRKSILPRLAALATVAVLGLGLLGPAQAAEKEKFRIAWSIYAGWMPWKYIGESGIMDKWADKYGIEVEIVQINDYIESINQYTAGQFDGVVCTSMDALSIPAAGGVDTTALIVGDYSNGNDGIVMKGDDQIAGLKGEDIHLVELSVSHYLLARALDSVGLSERDVNVINISDADLVSAFKSADVQNVGTWQPLLGEVEAEPGAHRVFDSADVPGHIKDLLVVNSETLREHPELGKALVGAWYEMMTLMSQDSAKGREVRAYLGEASGTDRAGYEMQLDGMKMFWTPQSAVAFITSAQAYDAMDSVRQFSFEHGLLGEGADSPDFVGIAFPDGKSLGNTGNTKLRFDTEYMRMAADGKL